MAQIPIGNFGQSVAAPQRGPRITGTDAGLITTKAVGDLANTVQGVATDQIAAQTRLDIEAKNLDAQTTAAKVRTTTNNDFADALDGMRRDVLDGKVPKDQAEEEWRTRSQALLEGRLNGVDPHYAGVMQAEFDGLQRAGANKVRDAVVQRDQHDTQANLMTLGEEYQRMAARDRPTAMAEYFAQIDAIAPRAGWQPDKIAQVKQQFREGTAYQQAFELVKMSGNDLASVKAGRELLNSDQFNDLDPQKRAALNAQLDGLETTLLQKQAIAEQRAANEAERRFREAQGAFTAAQARVDAGIPDSAEQTTITTHLLSGTPFLESYKAIQKQAREIGGAGAMPVPVLQQQIDALMAKRAKEGASDALDKRISALQKVSESQKAGYRADPWGEGLQRGVIQDVPKLDISSFESFAASLGSRRQSAGVLSVAAGEPVGLLRPDEAKSVAGLFSKLSAQEKTAMVGTIYKALDPQSAMATFKQIGKDDALLTVAAGLHGQQTARRSQFLGIPYGQTENRSVPQLMFSGEELVKNKQIKLPDEPARNSVFQDYVGNAIPNPQARLMAAQATDAIYAKLAFEAGMFDSPKVDARLYKRAASFVTGGLLEWNGGNKILPPAYGMPEGKAREVLMNITPEQVKAWGGVAGMTDEQAAEYIRTAPLESQTIGKYRVQAGGGILHNKTGGAFEMRF